MATDDYQLSEFTLLTEAQTILVRAGVGISNYTLWHRMRRGDYQGQKVGRDWWILTTELDRIIGETND
jgi:hypothetical protein